MPPHYGARVSTLDLDINVMKRILHLAAAFFLVAGTAQATTYNCQIKPRAKGSWVPRELVIEHNTQSDEVLVIGNLIKHYLGNPVQGRVDIANAKRTTFVWEWKNFDSAKQFTSTFLFRATVISATGAIIITSKPMGYRNSFRGKGTCVVK